MKAAVMIHVMKLIEEKHLFPNQKHKQLETGLKETKKVKYANFCS